MVFFGVIHLDICTAISLRSKRLQKNSILLNYVPARCLNSVNFWVVASICAYTMGALKSSRTSQEAHHH